MPSACLKQEKKAPMEAEDAMKQCIVVVDKKVRNLEKKKGKLETYREKSRKGDELNSDQKEAISNYDSVLRNLEFARELQKQFSEIQERAEKLLKRKAKCEKQERHNEEVARIQELLQVQSLLDNMGAEDVRQDFKDGNRGALTLSEETLNQLDELYKLISPSRDGEESYTSQLTQAAEHIVNFLDAKDKEVAGTTYKNLKDLIRQINECGYFDKTSAEEEPTTEQAEESEPKTEETQESAEETHVTEEETPVSSVTEPTSHPTPLPPTSADAPTPTSAVVEQQPPQQQSQIHGSPELQTLPNSLQTSNSQPQEVYTDSQAQVDSFFTTVQMARPRAFQEIVSSVQGSFDFLQDSEIDPQQKAKQSQEALHVDPAVVAAAHPLTAGSLHTTTTTDPLTQSFGSSANTNSFLEDKPSQQAPQYSQQAKNQSVADSSLSQSQGFSENLSAPSQPQSSQFGQSSTFDTDMDSKWGQGSIYLQSSATSDSVVDRSWGDQSNSGGGQSVSQSWAEQTSHTPTNAWSTGGQPETQQNQQKQPTSSDPPAPIPMPPSQQQGYAQQDNETKSSLNPNADIFSMYSNQSGFPRDSNDYDSNKHDRYGQSDMGSGYQTQGYRGRRDYDNRGPRGGRGGPRGMTNGYSGRGNNRGGNSYRGDDRRGGPRGNRGGPSQQGYSQRSHYQPDSYQDASSTSSSNNHSGPGFSNKWGGHWGGGPRGGPRGGSGPRGGGNRGNYSRPNSAHNQ